MKAERNFSGSGLKPRNNRKAEPQDRRELVPTVKQGIQQYAGTGITRYCMGCNMHRKLEGSNGKKDFRWRCGACYAAKLATIDQPEETK